MGPEHHSRKQSRRTGLLTTEGQLQAIAWADFEAMRLFYFYFLSWGSLYVALSLMKLVNVDRAVLNSQKSASS